ncbi:MAG: tandem-95 repeat protein [Thermoplasmatota archaeon]
MAIALVASILPALALAGPGGEGGDGVQPRASSRTVLGELFTATWCPYCPAAVNAMDKLLDDPAYFPSRLVVIEWHPTNNDIYGTQETDARISYYAVSGFPTGIFDGVARRVGGSTDPNNQAVYNDYKAMVDARPQSSAFRIDVAARLVNDAVVELTVNVSQVDTCSNSSLKVRAVVVEDLNITHNQGQYRHTARDVVIDTGLTISNGQTKSFTGNGTVGSGWDINKLAAVAMVQTDVTKEVLQATLATSLQRVVDLPPAVRAPLGELVIPEDGTDASIDLSSVFTDPEGDPLTYSYSGAQKINVTILGSSVTLRPDRDWSGTETIKFHARDAYNANPATEDITVTVSPVNDAPRLLKAISDFSMTEGSTRVGPDLDDHFADIDSSLTYTSSGGSRVSASINPSTHVVTFAAEDLWTGRETLTFTASDGELQASTTVNVTVVDINHPPAAAPIPDITIPEDGVDTSLNLNEVFTDLDGQSTLTFECWDNVKVAVTIDPDGTVTLRPASDWYGAERITFKALDGIAEPAEAPVNVTVTPVNDPPVRTGGLERISLDEETVYTTERSLDRVFSDVDGDTLEFLVDLDPGAGSAHRIEDIGVRVESDGTVTIAPARDVFGEFQLVFTARDPGGLEARYAHKVTIANVNDAPVVTDADPPTGRSLSMNEGESMMFTLTARDADGDLLEYTWSVDLRPQEGAGSEFEYAADFSSAGTHRITAVVTDGVERVELKWTVKVVDVNHRPVVRITSPVDGATFKSGAQIKFTASASDEDGDKLLYSWTSDGRTIGALAEFTSALPSGKHTIRVEVSDGKETASAEVTVIVKSATSPAATPGFGGLLLLAATAAAGALMCGRRRKAGGA